MKKKELLEEKISDVVSMINTDEEEQLLINFMRSDEKSRISLFDYMDFLMFSTEEERQEIYDNTGIVDGLISSKEDVAAMNEAVTQWKAQHPDYKSTREPNWKVVEA